MKIVCRLLDHKWSPWFSVSKYTAGKWIRWCMRCEKEQKAFDDFGPSAGPP